MHTQTTSTSSLPHKILKRSRVNGIVTIEAVTDKIYSIRGIKVIIDSDLAELYGVEAKALKQAVRRNINRFPSDFMFELTRDEFTSLRSQIVTLKRGKHSKYLPFAFTEQGVAMLSGILNSDRAIQVNIMRTFVKNSAHDFRQRGIETRNRRTQETVG